MAQKTLPNQGKHKGLYVYCSKCKKYFSWTKRYVKTIQDTTTYTEPECGDKIKRLSNCKSLDKHKYKVRVNISRTTKKRIKILNAENYDDAVLEYLAFERKV